METGVADTKRDSVDGIMELAIQNNKVESAERAISLAFLLCLLQAMDGIFTSIGVSRFGLTAEGNPFLRSLMQEFGEVQTLGFTKLVAIFVIITLAWSARKLPWINNAMGAIGFVYFFAAIIPWTYILFIKPLL